ncbi:hypothetical protein SPRG_08287 [Saprolegnia parasitica CBS 223.65]|uniref:Glycoside hydrolase family 5 domain-containing protein n=1 Tax=Saprolegnia parasitica (strain CBS 223.65) TaxID=695850 RepID=A0A067C6R7_SAPPC|nr:hypothetical protein SPRG_08287 [Saprolegnia parasitica CBS 223.65]KDO26484.1 hypothetical protein SPRG_08287 [Saprolegnia parasitica CBS 223.65]|eukprot:XP_012202919.1 hypothetical protein SPRG_08287 [Saprolegnia parasitica CBS 223.65]
MKTTLVVATALVGLATAQQPTTSQTFRVCRHTNYVADGNKIYAVDPANPSTKTELFIKGVTWSGMELPKQGIPMGLWGANLTQIDSGIKGTSLSAMMQFMANASINVVRFPLTADAVVKDTPPMVSYVHGENKEIALYPPGFVPRTSDFVARLIGAFQKYRIGIVLDVHDLVENFAVDAYWYYPAPSTVEESLAYKAAVVLATNYCKATYWNVLGIDLKNAMTDVTWAKSASDARSVSDWASAAQVIAAKVNALCPQWLVLTTGASSAKGESFSIPSRANETFPFWDGGNFQNATDRPLQGATNVVYAPQAHVHGMLPQAYLYAKAAGCGSNLPTTPVKEDTTCSVFLNGSLVANTKRALSCQNSKFACASYVPMAIPELQANVAAMLQSALGGVVAAATHPIVFSGFSAVYVPSLQPQQAAAFDAILQFIVHNTSGGFYANLNPDMEMYLEAPPAGKTILGKTRFGLMKTNSWQAANQELLDALSVMKSTPIPCYGDVHPGPPENAANALAPALLPFVVGALVYCWS